MTMNQKKQTALTLVILLIICAFFYFYSLGTRSLYNPDEGRYAEIAKEMVQRNDWVEPRLFNVDYLAKPILFYWLTMISFKSFGFTEFTARLMPVLFGLLGILATFWFTLKTTDKRTAIFSTLILASNIWYLQVSRFMVIDMVFTFFIVTCLYSYYLAFHRIGNHKVYYTLFYLGLGMAFLTKGFACFILVGFPLGLYLLFSKQIRFPRNKLLHLFGIFLFLVTTGAWLIPIYIREPDFFRIFVIHEHLQRFTSTDFEHQQPWYFFITLVPVLFIPWTFFIKPIRHAIFSQEDKGRNLVLFVLCAGLGIIFFFSISKTKLLTYCLPAFPFISIFLGRGWSLFCTTNLEKQSRILWWGSLPILITGIGAIITVLFLDFLYIERYPINGALTGAGIIFIIIGALCLYLSGLDKREHVFYLMITLLFLSSIPTNSAMTTVIDKNCTTKFISQDLKKLLKKTDTVYVYGNPNKSYDLPFYLDHPVILVDLLGELRPIEGLSDTIEDEESFHISNADFVQLLKEKKPFYCVMRKKRFERTIPAELRPNFVILKQTGKMLLLQSGKIDKESSAK